MDKSAEHPTNAEDETSKPFTLKGWHLIAGVGAFILFSWLVVVLLPPILAGFWVDNDGPDAVNGAAEVSDGGGAGVDSYTSVAQVVALSLGGAVGVAGVAVSIARHDQDRGAAERDRRRLHDEQERGLRDRFVTLLDLLSDRGDEVKRASALRGLAALADDWMATENYVEVQACVDAVCEYMRSNLGFDQLERIEAGEENVRRSGFAAIGARLRSDSDNSWSKLTVDLSGIRLPFRVEMHGVVVSQGGLVKFNDAVIGDGGGISLRNARIERGARMDFGRVSLEGDGAIVDLKSVQVMNGGLLLLTDVKATKAARLSIRGARIKGRGRIVLDGSKFSRGAMLIGRKIEVESGGILSLRAVRLSAAEIYMQDSGFAKDSILDISDADASIVKSPGLSGDRTSRSRVIGRPLDSNP